MLQIVGEELGVLPGMDSIFSAYSLERLVGIFGRVAKQNHKKDKFDVIVYDGMSSDEILRMISAASKARFGNVPLSLFCSLISSAICMCSITRL